MLNAYTSLVLVNDGRVRPSILSRYWGDIFFVRIWSHFRPEAFSSTQWALWSSFGADFCSRRLFKWDLVSFCQVLDRCSKLLSFKTPKLLEKSKLRNKSAGNALQMLWTKFEVNKINRNVSGSLSKMRCLLMVPLYSPKFWKRHNSKNWGKFKNTKKFVPRKCRIKFEFNRRTRNVSNHFPK